MKKEEKKITKITKAEKRKADTALRKAMEEPLNPERKRG